LNQFHPVVGLSNTIDKSIPANFDRSLATMTEGNHDGGDDVPYVATLVVT
jgi:hypothetical protein